MGRGKLEMKYTEDRRKRARIYKSRIEGAMKKAHDLSVLCGVDVVFASFSPDLQTMQCWPDNSSDFQRIIHRYQAKKPHTSPSEASVPSSTWTHDNELAAIDRMLADIRERVSFLEYRMEESPADDPFPFPDLPLSSLEGMPDHTFQLCSSSDRTEASPAEEPHCFDDLPLSFEGMLSASSPRLADSSSSSSEVPPSTTEDPTDLTFPILHDIAEYLEKPIPFVSRASKAFNDCYWDLFTRLFPAADMEPVFPSAHYC